MDLVLDIVDTFVLDRVYSTLLPSNTTTTIEYNQNIAQYIDLPPSEWAGKSLLPRDSPFRQGITLFFLTWLFGTLTYLTTSTLSYIFIFDKRTTTHPKFLTRQIPLEIQSALLAIPQMALLTIPFFLLELHGYSRLYSSTPPFPAYTYLQLPLFIAFTDFAIYWIHRYEHHPAVYKWLHKPHHRWIVPTPYASFAFHPLDGWAQSTPYHIFPFLFPLEKRVYLALFAFVTVWTVLIRSSTYPTTYYLLCPCLWVMLIKVFVWIDDGEYATKSPIINGSACHTYHHLYFNYNYGQFTTLWDRLGGSYRQPEADLFNRETKMGKEQWDKQVREMERMVREVEGVDGRVYMNGKKVQ